MARFRHGAFPGGNPWQFFRLMHLRGGLGRENRQFAARFTRHASENGLALARYARHASEMLRKSPPEDTPREDLAGKGPFSLHGPLKSRTARRSYHPASTKHPSARNPCAADQHRTARAAHNHAAALMAAHRPQHSRCQRQPHRKRSHTPPPATLRRQADVKSCAARAPQRQSATRGPTAP